MKIFTRIVPIVMCVLLGLGHAAAQSATVSGDLLTDWQQQKRSMMAIAEAMPETAFSFKPTEAQRTYAEQILHIAGANVYLMQHLGGVAVAPDVDTTDFTVFGLSATSKTAVLEALGAGYDYGIAVLQEFSDEQLLETVAGPRYLGNVTRATNPKNQIVFLSVHEYIHTQQNPRVFNILSLVLYEGVAEFVASKALEKKSPNPQIEFGKKNAKRIREVFENEMFYYNNLYKWLDGNAPNEFGMRDLGYYVGYQICENYYNQADNKENAIKTMIELDYTNESEVENFINKANYFSKSLDSLYQTFESKRPTVIRIKQFENNSQNVDPKTKEITIEFSQALNGHNTGVDFGELGQDAFPKGTLNERKWSADNKSWTIPVELEPNKVYQIFISNNFRTQESIPLKPYLIEFKTANK